MSKQNTLSCTIDKDRFSFTQNGSTTECYPWYRDNYYCPQITYCEPVKDKGKLAYEIIKILRDEKLIEIKTVKNFIDIMDKLIPIL